MASLSMVISTNLNGNLIRGELLPLVEVPEVREIVVVQDEAGPPMPKVRYVALGAKSFGKVLHGLRRLFVLCIEMARTRPSIVMGVYMMPHGLLAYLLARITRRRLWLHVIGGPGEVMDGGYWVDQWRAPHPGLERLFLRILRRAEVVMVVGTESKKYLASRGVDPDRIHVMSQKIDSRRFRPVPDVRHDYDLIITAQLISRKRVDLFLRIVADLKIRHPHIRAAVLGDGPLRGELERLADSLGIRDHVDFLGFHEDTERFYNRARVFVLTSAAEGLSVAMMEAMCCGLPAVVPAVGDLGDVVRNGVTGYLIEGHDQAAFVAALSDLIEHEELRRTLGANARSTILDGYTVEDGARGWHAALRSTVCYS
jgi:glycosyltransferase involved in cell wall biosynthesis